MFYLGIDPDTHGSFVLLNDLGVLQSACCIPRIGTEFDIVGIVRYFRETLPYQATVCHVEKVQSRAFIPEGMSEGAQKGIILRSTKLFRLSGILLTCCACFGVPVIEITPGTWMKKFGLAGEKDRDKRKQKIAVAGGKRWPGLDLGAKVRWSQADAAFIAEYGRLTWTPPLFKDA